MTNHTPAPSVTAQGNYAGSVSRGVAYAIDLFASTAVYTLALAAISYVVQIVTGKQVSWNRQDIAVVVTYVAWEFFYFGYSWAVSGRTFGMAVLGVRVVRADGAIAEPRRGVLRALVFPLSFLLFGLGFAGILVQRALRRKQPAPSAPRAMLDAADTPPAPPADAPAAPVSDAPAAPEPAGPAPPEPDGPAPPEPDAPAAPQPDAPAAQPSEAPAREATK